MALPNPKPTKLTVAGNGSGVRMLTNFTFYDLVNPWRVPPAAAKLPGLKGFYPLGQGWNLADLKE